MRVIHKNQEILLPDQNLIKTIFYRGIGLCIDYGFIFLPILVIISWYFIQYSPTLFYLFYIPALMLSIYWIYLVFLNFYIVKINSFEFKDKKIKSPIKFIFISDLHIGRTSFSMNVIKLQKIINIINKQEKDFVLIGGDILDNTYDEELLNELAKIKGRKITILGNHDVQYIQKSFQTKETPVRLISQLNQIGFEVLANQGISIQDDLFIGGIKDLYTLDFDIHKAFEGSDNKQFHLLLSHNPDIISFKEELQEVDLILAGHNHAGQINIFGLHMPMPSLRQWLTRGIFKISDKTTLLLSQGVGSGHSRVRLGTDFEILVLNIKPTEKF